MRLLSHQGLATPSPLACPHRRSLLTRGTPGERAHQQESMHAEHHEQEEGQGGGDQLHGVVAEMPLGQAGVHQLLVEVIGGGFEQHPAWLPFP